MPAPKGHPPYNVNGEGGRPKIYTDEYIDNEANILLEWIDEKNDNIFIEDFCILRDLYEDIIAIWTKKNERFCRAYDKLKTKQKVNLFKGGLTKKWSFPMCNLLLSHNHNVYSKTEQKITTQIGDPLDFIFNSLPDTSEIVNDAK